MISKEYHRITLLKMRISLAEDASEKKTLERFLRGHERYVSSLEIQKAVFLAKLGKDKR